MDGGWLVSLWGKTRCWDRFFKSWEDFDGIGGWDGMYILNANGR